MKVVVFGAGGIGSVHLANLADDPRVSGLVVADLDAERARTVAAQIGAKAVDTSMALAEQPDAAVIAAPTPAHAQLLRACVDASTPTFCEKPLSGDLAGCVELAQLVDDRDAVVQIGFQRRFDRAHAELRELLRRRMLGTVQVIRIASHDHYALSDEYVAGSGGIYRDLLIHDFDALRWITGLEVTTVYATGAIRVLDYVGRYGDVDNCVLALTLTDGTLVSVSAGRGNGRGEDVRLEVIGTEDCVAIGLSTRTPLRSLEPDFESFAETSYDDHVDRFRAAYRAELEHFISLARGEVANVCSPRDTLGTMVVAEAATRSANEGRPVALSPADYELL